MNASDTVSSMHSETHVRAVHEAAEWYARLNDGRADAELQRAWALWHAADAEHQFAWSKVQQICQRFGKVPGKIGGATLEHAMRHSGTRRSVLRSLLGFTVVGAGAAVSYKVLPERLGHYDYVTSTGERREVTLADGSSLSINTRSKVNVAFTPTQRLVRLYSGEVLIATQADPELMPRPFLVETGHGRVLALGTRFNVRIEDGQTHVSVLEKAVELTPLNAPEQRLRLDAGQQAVFSNSQVGERLSADVSAGSWQSGRLVVVDMPLSQLVSELDRYRPGHLQCDASVARIRVSGAFPLDDTDQALAALVENFPVRVENFTRYWTRITTRT